MSIRCISEKFLWAYDVNPRARILMTSRDAFYAQVFRPERFAMTIFIGIVIIMADR